MIISSSGDPTLEPPKISLDPPPTDAEVPKVVENVDLGDSSEKTNSELPPAPPLETEVLVHNIMLHTILSKYLFLQ